MHNELGDHGSSYLEASRQAGGASSTKTGFNLFVADNKHLRGDVELSWRGSMASDYATNALQWAIRKQRKGIGYKKLRKCQNIRNLEMCEGNMCDGCFRVRSATMARHGWVVVVKRHSGGANDEMRHSGTKRVAVLASLRPNSSYSRELAGSGNCVCLVSVINVLPPSCRWCRDHPLDLTGMTRVG